MKGRDFIEAYALGKDMGQASNLYIMGNILYSYGKHYPVSVRFEDENGYKYALVNATFYSSSTAKHVSWARYCLSMHGYELVNVNTDTINAFISGQFTAFKMLASEYLKRENEKLESKLESMRAEWKRD